MARIGNASSQWARTFRRIPIALVFLASAGMDCGGSLPPISPCLLLSDVNQKSPGDATGTELSGQFRRLSALEISCNFCDGNTVTDPSCDPPTIPADQVWTFTQTDGELILEISSGGRTIELAGGIEVGGRFSVGGIAAPETNTGVQTGQGLLLFEGTYSGDRVIGELTIRLTANSPNGTGRVLDFEQVTSAILDRAD